MRKVLVSTVVAICFVVLVSAASADSITFSMSGSGWSSSGTFQATPTAPGTWLVTGATGLFNGVTITGICPIGSCLYSYNNLYYWPPPVVDYYGIMLTLADNTSVNICYDVNGCGGPAGVLSAFVIQPDGSYTGYYPTSYDFSQPTPEPGTLIMLGSGILGVAGILRRRTM